ncbi:formate dehydrogenase subunit gamma [Desulfonatronum parangueonense]
MSNDAKTRIKRFTLTQRLFHLVLMITFLIQAATGLARMYHETSWGQGVGYLFGGFDASLTVHIYVGIFMIVAFLVHVIYALFKMKWRPFPSALFGPDSLMPRFSDMKQFFLHLRWIFGGSKHPPIDRWGYWEKFDYWAVFWGMVILGVTGLLLAYPLTSSKYIPGWGLNVAFWIHRIEAILAMAHIFIIHFFIAHLRRTTFPMDRTIFEGSADLHAAKHERPAWIARLTSTGQIDHMIVEEAPAYKRAVFLVVGYAAMLSGLYLLVGGLMHALRITW